MEELKRVNAKFEKILARRIVDLRKKHYYFWMLAQIRETTNTIKQEL